MIKTWAVTDTGLVRKENQDTYRIARNGDICVVCDGMGGAAAPFCEHGDRPLPVQARKCPKLTGGKDNAEILSHAAVQQSKKQRKPP